MTEPIFNQARTILSQMSPIEFRAHLIVQLQSMLSPTVDQDGLGEQLVRISRHRDQLFHGIVISCFTIVISCFTHRDRSSDRDWYARSFNKELRWRRYGWTCARREKS